MLLFFLELTKSIVIGNTKQIQTAWKNLFLCLSPNNYTDQSHLYRKLFKQVFYFCQSHLHDNISVNDMAQVACMSRFHFSRLFRRYTGISPHAFLMQLRLQHSRQHLRAGLSISDAAIFAGFYDASHFIHTFFSFMGTSPKLFRNAFFKD